MKLEPFLEFADKNVVLFDGAMGTELYKSGVFINRCYDEINISNVKLVSQIHKSYIEAGCDVIETNTFGASRFKLKKHGLEEQLWAINSQGAKIARDAAEDNVYVAGGIGPLGIRLEPWGKVSLEEAFEVFSEQIKALLSGGVDLFILETFSDLSELHQAILAVKENCDLPVIAQLSIDEYGKATYGTPPEFFTKKLDEWPADIIGINCAGPKIMLETLEIMRPLTRKKISMLPNAGKPREVDNRFLYMTSPEYMGEYAKRFISAGASIVGGCCGTTPQDIKSMRDAIKALRPPRFKNETVKKDIEETSGIDPVPLEKRSKMAAKIAAGEFVVSVELTPPRSPNLDKIIASAKELKEINVDAINIPDGPRASSRVSPLATAVLIEREVGIETVLHYCCRDRNMLGMQSDLLGAYSLGLRNVLLITGDPPKMGDYPDATAVFDVDSVGLTNIVTSLNHGIDIGKNRVDPPTGFLKGVGLNPGAIDIEKEITKFEWKVKAGADFAITQPVFDVKQLKSFLKKIEHVRIPVIAGLWPLVSLKNAEFMNNEVPGISVPDWIIDKMRRAADVKEQRKIGVEVAIDILKEVREMIEGVQISAPFGRIKVVKKILKAI